MYFRSGPLIPLSQIIFTPFYVSQSSNDDNDNSDDDNNNTVNNSDDNDNCNINFSFWNIRLPISHFSEYFLITKETEKIASPV